MADTSGKVYAENGEAVFEHKTDTHGQTLFVYWRAGYSEVSTPVCYECGEAFIWTAGRDPSRGLIDSPGPIDPEVVLEAEVRAELAAEKLDQERAQKKAAIRARLEAEGDG